MRGVADADEQVCVRLEIARVPFEACDVITTSPGAPGEDDAGESAEPGGAGPEGMTGTPPPVLRFVPPSEGCVLWLDCGWVWRPPSAPSPDEGESAAARFLGGNAGRGPRARRLGGRRALRAPAQLGRRVRAALISFGNGRDRTVSPHSLRSAR